MNQATLVIFTVFTWLAYQTVQLAAGSIDLFGIVDKYGYPTAVSIVAFWWFSRQSKIQAGERNDLIARNNDLTQQLIAVVEKGPLCKFEK